MKQYIGTKIIEADLAHFYEVTDGPTLIQSDNEEADYNRHRRRGMPRLVISRDGKLMVPPKCVMVEDGQYLPAVGTHYIRFVMPEVKRPETHRRKGGAHELL